jgi:hypothetical protein
MTNLLNLTHTTNLHWSEADELTLRPMTRLTARQAFPYRVSAGRRDQPTPAEVALRLNTLNGKKLKQIAFVIAQSRSDQQR